MSLLYTWESSASTCNGLQIISEETRKRKRRWRGWRSKEELRRRRRRRRIRRGPNKPNCQGCRKRICHHPRIWPDSLGGRSRRSSPGAAAAGPRPCGPLGLGRCGAAPRPRPPRRATSSRPRSGSCSRTTCTRCG
ncbi:hypothetical protein Mapa_000142 [Marchantia paleacea]|nr:hypothetical protein Mapa_000142 [Marchantia paleacea]